MGEEADVLEFGEAVVARAGDEAGPVEDLDVAAGGADQMVALEDVDGVGDAGPGADSGGGGLRSDGPNERGRG